MRTFILALFLLFETCIGHAAIIPVIHDPVLEKRYVDFTHELRCLKCQHQSIAESDADFSQDVKAWVAQAILDGKSDHEINQMLHERFGDRIFLNPPWQGNTYLLWFFPVLCIIVGMLFWYRRIR